MKSFKLGKIVKDSATSLQGILTLLQIRQDFTPYYNFQPSGLNPEDGMPVRAYWLEPVRIIGGEVVDVELPIAILKSEVKDTATGFHGIATTLTLFMSGCIHVEIQPQGKNKKTGSAFESLSLDLLRCEGKDIKKISEAKREEVRKEKPSPMVFTRFVPKI